MCLEKPIIAPDLPIIKKYVNHRVNGLLFPKENIKALTQITLQVVSKGKLSSLATNIASTGEDTAKNMMALDSIEGYASLIENILHLPSEVASPREISEIPSDIKTKWQWHLFEAIEDREYVNRTLRIHHLLDKVEGQRNRAPRAISEIPKTDSFIYDLWEEEKRDQIMKARRAREDDEVRDKSEQPRGTWEEVYKNAKKADRNKNDLHERDDGELERTGQPLCIYEPYFGQGSWSFLHTNSLYRGIRLELAFWSQTLTFCQQKVEDQEEMTLMQLLVSLFLKVNLYLTIIFCKMQESFWEFQAGECLKREKDRVSHYLHSNSEPKLLEVVFGNRTVDVVVVVVIVVVPHGIGGAEGPDRIFVGGLPYYFTEVQIRELLESFGPLRGFDLVKDRDTGNSKGYGLCVYEDQAATDVACAALNGLKKRALLCLSWNLESRLDNDELSPEQVNDVKDFIGDYVERN
uniref:RRM domain-containing protein n=1 Tax=Lactuca sativa TaxID=4236 RepID=A0A9R1X6J4_LACSA|nr:hypothetical protein LSAT_V11C600308620 [Lactuca sativa]